MVTDSILKLKAMQAKMAELQRSIASELAGELASLPAQYGFKTVAAFLAAVRSANRKRRGARSAKKTPAVKRKRTTVTDEIRAKVKKLFEENKTGKDIAAILGISLPTVQNIKKALGLTKAVSI